MPSHTYMRAWAVALFLLFTMNSQSLWADESTDVVCPCIDPASSDVDSLLACFVDTRCYDDRKEIEIALRAKGRSLTEAMEDYMQLANNPLFNDAERGQYLVQIDKGKRQLKVLKKLIDFSGGDELIEPLYIDFDYPEKGYHRHYYSFNIGYEYVSLNSIFQQGFPRVGFLVYRRYGDTPTIGEGIGKYGIHFSGALQLTSSGELSTDVGTKSVKNTLQLTADMFVPFFHSMLRYDNTSSDYLGVLLSYDATKTEEDAHAKSRVYAGFRNAINPETYVDILTGMSGDISNNRIEIRTQLPVYKFATGSRIFFGAIFNFAAPWEGETRNVQDVMRFYLHWNADFGKILEGVSSAIGL